MRGDLAGQARFSEIPVVLHAEDPAKAAGMVGKKDIAKLYWTGAAWGAAIGNVIGDFFGGIGPGDLFGFFGNFLYGTVPYKVWALLSRHQPVPKTPCAVDSQ